MKDRAVRACAALALILLLVTVASPSPGARAQGTNRAGLVVRFGEGSVVTRCIEFSESEISGYEVLQRSGLHVVPSQPSGMGVAICKIEDTGCPASDCFCQCQGESCVYWSYWHLVDGQWLYSPAGASAYKAHDGEVQGWSWSQDTAPPAVAFDEICAPPATATSMPTATPTYTPVPPTDMPTPLPTATTPPTATPLPPRVEFRVEPGTIVAGGCAELRWDVENVQAIYLDDQGVGGQESRTVCPGDTQTYVLRVVGTAGESRHSVTVHVIQPTSTPVPTAAHGSGEEAFTPASQPVTPTPVASPMPAPSATLARKGDRSLDEKGSTPTAAPTDTPVQPTAPPGTEAPTATPTGTLVPAQIAAVPSRPSTTPTLWYTPRPSSTIPQGVTPPSDGRAASMSAEHLFFILLMLVLGMVLAVVVRQRRGT
jgi:hypothetical protein